MAELRAAMTSLMLTDPSHCRWHNSGGVEARKGTQVQRLSDTQIKIALQPYFFEEAS